MKNLLIILFVFSICVNASSQVAPSLTLLSNTATTDKIRVEFTSSIAIPGPQDLAPINVWLKFPGGAMAGITTTLTVNPFGLGTPVGQDFGLDHYVQIQSVTAQAVGTFPMGTPVIVAEIDITGATGPVELSGGEFGDAPMGSSNWPGTALVQGTANLLNWPIAESVGLPITLRTFDVTKKGDDTAKLNWVTSSEENTSHFEVQRSVDGKQWSKIGIVNAAGNSVTEQRYQFDDSNLKSIPNDDKIFYYRLRAVDFDDQFDYSAVKNIKLDYADIVLSVYPNPTSDGIWVRMSHPRESREELTYTIVDISGKIIQAGNLGNAKEVNEYIALTDDVVNGTYMLNIDLPTTNLRTERIVVVGQQ